ncbi:SET and MYND domain-containing protein DDB_G0273589-like [Sitodiplosis mosellana]|uniref:SET and MYND domain-containing protein DDB_G0273589-like n=1 Tax=Sitodiplosis mosellana TaxID=263140 RepID=UPI00244483C4|nr:SET and MYND domain-containing protein DDB_G0273589-like [Sitodiplosis mosellana]
MNLWKKESYVNLFPFVPDDIALKSVQLLNTLSSRKSNEKSTELRMEGNTQFGTGQWSVAMDLYTKSLCYAETGSENVALAYSNRSACFVKMRMYKEAIVDIQLAKEANFPERLVPKLEQRERDCRKLMSSVKTPPKYVCKLSYAADKNFPGMANVVEIKCDEEFGRHLIAKRDIPAGQTVMLEDCYVLVRTDVHLLCQTCYCANANFIACKQCPDAVFCSNDCINRNHFHKWECNMPKAWNDDIQFQIRAVVRAIEAFTNVDDLMQFVDSTLREDPKKLPTSMHDSKAKYHFYFKLQRQESKSSEQLGMGKMYESVVSNPKIAALFNTTEKQRFLMHLVAHNILIMKNNSLGNESNLTVAHLHSLMNHSCAPNTATYAAGNQRFTVTVRPVKKGQQLCSPYLDCTGVRSLEERHTALKSGWNFVCKCEQCVCDDKPINVEQIISNPCMRFVTQNFAYEDKQHDVMKKCLSYLNNNGHQRWSKEMQMMASMLAGVYKKKYSY